TLPPLPRTAAGVVRLVVAMLGPLVRSMAAVTSIVPLLALPIFSVPAGMPSRSASVRPRGPAASPPPGLMAGPLWDGGKGAVWLGEGVRGTVGLGALMLPPARLNLSATTVMLPPLAAVVIVPVSLTYTS